MIGPLADVGQHSSNIQGVCTTHCGKSPFYSVISGKRPSKFCTNGPLVSDCPDALMTHLPTVFLAQYNRGHGEASPHAHSFHYLSYSLQFSRCYNLQVGLQTSSAARILHSIFMTLPNQDKRRLGIPASNCHS